MQYLISTATAAVMVAILAGPVAGAPQSESGKLPALDTILDGYEKVTAADGGDDGLYTLYFKEDTQDLLAVLPPNFEQQRILLTNTLARGFLLAGRQNYSVFRYWKRFGNRIALVEPQLGIRSSGDLESQQSLKRLYSDFVKLDVPIVAEGPGGTPVIDFDELFIDQTAKFHQFAPGGLDPRLGTFESINLFKKNLRISVKMPWRMGASWPDDGRQVTLTYSISLLPETPQYTPREADPRVGYFLTSYYDLGRITDTPIVRYIHRWKIEKADPSLKLSPPLEPIVFYIDHKTPIRYRRWVRDGILEWNKAFRIAGIVNAIEVHQQDVRTGAHMEKDPEDVQYNFVVWNSNDIGFAQGPSRVDPRTGQILDADVMFNDGWISAGFDDYRNYLANMAVEGASRETIAWLNEHPRWDPRERLLPTSQRTDTRREQDSPARITGPNGTHVLDARGAHAHHNGACRYGCGRAIDMSLARLLLSNLHTLTGDVATDELPLDFVGAMVKDVITHEIGHVLGLRHNFKASAAYAIEDINSPTWLEENRPISASVMDYNAFNYHTREGKIAGRPFMTSIGPYDEWAIRFGYGDDEDLESILSQSTKPEHAYLTDEDTYGPDPQAQTRDLGRNTLQFVDEEMVLVQELRQRIPERALREGKTFQRARDAYMTLLIKHSGCLAIAGRYIGGVSVHRDLVGDADRPPTEVVSAAQQRRAMAQVIRYAFQDEAFGLTPELLDLMSYDKWMDDGLVPQGLPDPQLDVHDLILGVQAARLTHLFSPTRLRRIFDSEHRITPDQDVFSVAELFDTVSDAIWSELAPTAEGPWTTRQPLISSTRQNLQHEYLDRLISLALDQAGIVGAARMPVATLASSHLDELAERIGQMLDAFGARLDVYSRAHLKHALKRIEQAESAVHVRR